MRASAPWGVMVALTAPAPAWALGLGDIELHSALNQPFRAEIGLTATNEELQSLRVTLAGREVFERSGLDRPAFMSGFEFGIGRNAAGRSIVTVTSRESVAEPFVTLIVEANWSSGNLQREYTVFLDPPTLLPRAEAPITAPRAAPSQPAAPISREPAPTAPQPRPQPVVPVTPPASRAAPPPSTTDDASGTTYGPVQRAETLWAIAERYQAAGATMNQTMLAIYAANPGSFGGNINVLRVGSILRIPGRNELLAASPAEATAEVRRQMQAWGQSAATDRLVLVPPSADSAVPTGGTAGRDAAAEAELSRLRAEVNSLRRELDESRDLIQVRNQELANLAEQLEAAGRDAEAPADTGPETNTSPGVDIDPSAVSTEPPTSGAERGNDTPPVVDNQPPAQPATQTAPERPTPTVVSRPPAPSLVDRILGWATSWVALVGAGVVAILFGALWFMRRRREEPLDDVTGQWDALEAGMEETKVPRSIEPRIPIPTSRRGEDLDEDLFEDSSPFIVEERASSTTLPIEDADEIAAEHYALASTEPSTDDTMSASAIVNLDGADPIAEADFHMAYGLYDQAAELLSKELKADPTRRDLQIKLLEVFFVWGNREEFLDAAQHLRGQMGQTPDADWDKVLIMGKQICPDAALFADSAGVRGGVDVSFGEDDDDALDFAIESTGDELDLDIGEATSIDLLETVQRNDGIDLDLTGNRAGLGDATATLDIGQETAAGIEAALLGGEEDTVEEPGGDARTMAVPGTVDAELDDTRETAFSGSMTEDLWADFTIDSSVMDNPTLEEAGADNPTLETPAWDDGFDDAPDDRTTEIPGMRSSAARADKTAEIELNDLGLEVGPIDDPLGLDDLAAEIDGSSLGDTQEQPALDDAELLSATGITQVLRDENDTRSVDTGAQTRLEGTIAGDRTEVMRHADTEFDLDLDDLSAALSDAEAAESRPSMRNQDFTLGATTPVDLDVGGTFIGDEEPSGSTDNQRAIDPQTLTEVGTKLDLARAYIDMGDPDGARSILDEVVSEGDRKQRAEAQSLIDALEG